MYLTLGIDQNALGEARPIKFMWEFVDEKRPKTFLNSDQEIRDKSGDDGEYRIALLLDEYMMGKYLQDSNFDDNR